MLWKILEFLLVVNDKEFKKRNKYESSERIQPGLGGNLITKSSKSNPRSRWKK